MVWQRSVYFVFGASSRDPLFVIWRASEKRVQALRNPCVAEAFRKHCDRVVQGLKALQGRHTRLESSIRSVDVALQNALTSFESVRRAPECASKSRDGISRTHVLSKKSLDVSLKSFLERRYCFLARSGAVLHDSGTGNRNGTSGNLSGEVHQ